MMKHRYLFAFAMLTTVIFTGNSSLVAAESTIETRICDGVQGATLMITSPASDSLIDSSNVTISGDVTQSNQLEVFVDDAFNSVVSLDSSASHFNTIIQLPAGTHKVTVTAIDACQVNNTSQNIVLTYQPAQLPSMGSEVPTGVAEEGGSVGSPQPTASSIDDHPPATIVERFIAPVFDNIVDSLDLQPSRADNAPGDGVSNMHRFAMTVGGLVLLFAASPIAGFVSTLLAAGTTELAKRQLAARSIVQLIGALLIALIFIL